MRRGEEDDLNLQSRGMGMGISRMCWKSKFWRGIRRTEGFTRNVRVDGDMMIVKRVRIGGRLHREGHGNRRRVGWGGEKTNDGGEIDQGSVEVAGSERSQRDSWGRISQSKVVGGESMTGPGRGRGDIEFTLSWNDQVRDETKTKREESKEE